MENHSSIWFVLPHIYDGYNGPTKWIWDERDLKANRELSKVLNVQTTATRSWTWPHDYPRFGSDVATYMPYYFPDSGCDIAALIAKHHAVSNTLVALLGFIDDMTNLSRAVPNSSSGLPKLQDNEIYYAPQQYRTYPAWLASHDPEYPLDPQRRAECFQTHVISMFGEYAEGAWDKGQQLYVMNIAVAREMVRLLLDSTNI